MAVVLTDPESPEKLLGGLAEQAGEGEGDEGGEGEVAGEAGIASDLAGFAGYIMEVHGGGEPRGDDRGVIQGQAEDDGAGDEENEVMSGGPRAVESAEQGLAGDADGGSCEEKGETRTGAEAGGEEDGDHRRRSSGAEVGRHADRGREGDLQPDGDRGEGVGAQPGGQRGGQDQAEGEPGERGVEGLEHPLAGRRRRRQ